MQLKHLSLLFCLVMIIVSVHIIAIQLASSQVLPRPKLDFILTPDSITADPSSEDLSLDQLIYQSIKKQQSSLEQEQANETDQSSISFLTNPEQKTELWNKELQSQTTEKQTAEDNTLPTKSVMNTSNGVFYKSIDSIRMKPIAKIGKVISSINDTAGKFKNYNSSVLGISLEYPANWTLTENPNNVSFLSSNLTDSRNFTGNIMMTISVYPFTNISLDEWVNAKYKQYRVSDRDKYGFFSSVSEKEHLSGISFKGHPTQTFVYSGGGGFPNYQGWYGIDSFFTFDNKIFHIQYRTQSEDYLFFREIILDSLKIDGSRTGLQEINSSEVVTYNNISKSPKASDEDPSIETSENGDVYIVWIEDTGGQRVLFSRSVDGAVSFSRPIQLDNGNATHYASPQITTAGSNLYVTWKSDDVTAFTTSADKGATFTGERALSYEVETMTNDEKEIVFLNDVVISVLDKYVFLIINDASPSPGNPRPVLFVRSLDNGITFENPIYLSKNGTGDVPAIAVGNNGVLYVTWLDENGQLLKKSMDYGATFSNEIDLFKGSCTQTTRLIAQDNNLYAACLYHEAYLNPPDEIGMRSSVEYQAPLFTRSTDGGATFGHIYSLDNKTQEPWVHSLNIAANKNNVYVVWDKGDDGIHFRRSIDVGTTFGNVLQISNDNEVVNEQGAVYSLVSDLDVSGDTLQILWHSQYDDVYDVVLGTSRDKGMLFELPLNVSRGYFTGDDQGSDMVVYGNNTYVVWSNIIKVADEYGEVETTSDLHLAKIPNNIHTLPTQINALASNQTIPNR